MKKAVIPDTQIRPGRNTRSLEWAGKFIQEKQPDVVVHLGDHFDFPSLSSYDKGKKRAEGKRVSRDFSTGVSGIEALMSPVKYGPRWVVTLGNHCERAYRFMEENPNIDSLPDPGLAFSTRGFEVHPFLRPVRIGGVNFCHIFPRNQQGRIAPSGLRMGPSSAMAMLKANLESCIAGHSPGLSVATYTAGSKMIQGIIAGSYYEGHEEYQTPQGNNYWRGIILLHRVKNGTFDPCFVSLGYLKERYTK